MALSGMFFVDKKACSLFRLLINMLLVRGSFVALFILPVFSCFVYEWNRLHGITLSRAFRPVVNVASVLATYK
jgi:hypothetical protein